MFEIRYSTDAAGTEWETFIVTPAPTDVEYPPKRKLEKKVTEDGAIVVQRYLKDDRPRRWVWKGYRDTVPGYNALWDKLVTFEAKARLEAGLWATVQIKDDITGASGFEEFTTVKILHVDREVRKGGGPVTYEETSIEFYVTS